MVEVLLAVHEFFQQLGIDEIRQRGNTDDKPLRMVKTLLHELCKRRVRRRSECLADPPLSCDPCHVFAASHVPDQPQCNRLSRALSTR